jgi:hypothetical protein
VAIGSCTSCLLQQSWAVAALGSMSAQAAARHSEAVLTYYDAVVIAVHSVMQLPLLVIASMQLSVTAETGWVSRLPLLQLPFPPLMSWPLLLGGLLQLLRVRT